MSGNITYVWKSECNSLLISSLYDIYLLFYLVHVVKSPKYVKSQLKVHSEEKHGDGDHIGDGYTRFLRRINVYSLLQLKLREESYKLII